MKHLILSLAVMVAMSSSLFAQKDTVAVDGYYETGGTYGTLNDAIQAAKDAGTINNTVFALKPFETYVLSSSIFIDLGESLDIYAPKPGEDRESAPPQIVWTEEEIDRAYLVQSYGDVRMQNVWLRYADILGNKVSSSVTFENQETADDPEVGFFDGVIFDYAGIGAEAGGSVTVKADHFDGTFLNCYFRNNSDNHFQYYGRAVSFPYQSSGWHYDRLFFENTTFSNLARIVMMEGNEFADNIHLNHITMLNSVENVIQSGWIRNLSITNSIIVNPWMLGYRAADVCDVQGGQDYDDFEDGLCDNPGGSLLNVTPVDSFGFEVEFTDYDRQIWVSNTSYVYQDYLLDWMQSCPWCQEQIQQRMRINLHHPYPPFGEDNIAFMDSTDENGNKVFITMNIDSTSMYYVDPEFIVPATNQDTMLIFVENKWNDNADIDWSYQPAAGYNQAWPLPENLAYNNAELQTAGMGGFPLGDLNWYPDQLDAWAAQRDQEWAQINDWMQNGVVSSTESVDEVPSSYTLEQNFPNPFNPTTQINFTVPQSGDVSLRVYNTLGHVVATLADGSRQAGSYTVTFDASGLPSGVYYYRLEGEAGVALARKLVLIK